MNKQKQSEAVKALLPGRNINYRYIPGEGIPALFIHGVGSSLDTWGNIPLLLEDAGVGSICLDLPGHGASSAGPGDYSLGAMASTARDLADHLGVAKMHLVGHSLGGGVAMQFAYQYPERVETLTLISSGGLGPDTNFALKAAALPGSGAIIKMAVNPVTVKGAKWSDRTLRRFGLKPLDEETLIVLDWLATPERRDAFLATLRSVVGPKGQSVSALDKLHLLSARKVLLIWGDSDPVIPHQHGVSANEILSDSLLVLIPGAGHEPHRDDPETVADLLIELFKDK